MRGGKRRTRERKEEEGGELYLNGGSSLRFVPQEMTFTQTRPAKKALNTVLEEGAAGWATCYAGLRAGHYSPRAHRI